MTKKILVLITVMSLMIPQKAFALSLAPPPENLPKEVNLLGVYLLMTIAFVGLVVMAFAHKNDLVKWFQKYFVISLVLGITLLLIGKCIVMEILGGEGFIIFGFSVPRINDFSSLGYPEVTRIRYRDLYTASNLYNLLVSAVVGSLSLWLRREMRHEKLPWITIPVLILIAVQVLIFLVGVGWTVYEYVDFELMIDSIFSSLVSLG